MSFQCNVKFATLGRHWYCIDLAARFSKHEKKLTATEMKMLRMSAGVTLLDHTKSDHIRGSLKVSKTVVESVHEERTTWFERVYQHSDENVTKRAINLDVPPVRRPGAQKTSWKRQMDKRQRDYGLTQEEKEQRLEPRRRLRSYAQADPRDYGQ